MEVKKLTAYALERECAIANGYLKKQSRGKGTIGSDILEKIHNKYIDLTLLWLLTGKGSMLIRSGRTSTAQSMEEEETTYHTSKEDMITVLRKQVDILERSNADKDRIIALLDAALQQAKSGQ
jgi:hypothetical protein